MTQEITDTIRHQDFEVTVDMPSPLGAIELAPRRPASSLQGKPSQWAIDLAYLAKHLGKWVLVCMIVGYGGYRGVAWSGDHVVDPLVASTVAKDEALTKALDRNERLTTALEANQKTLLLIQSDLAQLKRKSQ